MRGDSGLGSIGIKRAVAIAVPLLILGLCLGLITSATTAFPTGAANELQAFFRSSANQTIRTEALVRARRPWALGPALNLVTAGDSTVFETDVRYDLSAPTPSGVATSVIEWTAGEERAPLPYPPREVWCILVRAGPNLQVILLARHHREPYQTDWIIHHQPAAPAPESWVEILELVGCEEMLAGPR